MKYPTPIRSHLADMLQSHVPYIISLESLSSAVCTEVHETMDMETLMAALHSWGLLNMGDEVPVVCEHLEHVESCLHCRCATVTSGWCRENIVNAVQDIPASTLSTVYALVSGYVRNLHGIGL